MNQRMFLILAILAMATLGCLRETGIEQLPVNATTATIDTLGDLVKGKDASARVGDYILRNNQIQLVLNADFYGGSRTLFSPKSGGSLIDLTTLFEFGSNRTLTPTNDDWLNQLSQGVNMNRHTPIAYDQILVQAPDGTTGSLVLSGYVYDLDGSLAAAGASIDNQGRLVGCKVTTTYTMVDSDTFPNPDTTSEETTFERASTYVTVTTVISNTGQTVLPISDVNDIIYTTHETGNAFVPYPGWGFKRPATVKPTAYPNYVNLQPKQLNATQYAFLSRAEILLKVQEEYAEEINNDILYLGKAQMPQSGLVPGGAFTFIRELLAFSEGTSTASASRLIEIAGSLLTENKDPNNMFATRGRAQVALHTNDERGVIEGEMTLEFIKQSVKYFNGTSFVQLEEGKTFPIFGDSPITNGSAVSASYTVFLPPGQVAVRANARNSAEFYRDTRPVTRLDADGKPVKDADGNVIIDFVDSVIVAKEPANEATLIAMGTYNIGPKHVNIDVAAETLEGRRIFSRLTVKPTDPTIEMTLGDFPFNSQGSILYLDRNEDVNSSGSAVLRAPPGVYQVLASRGPLNNVNIFNIDSLNTKPEGSTDPIYGKNFPIVLGSALTLSNYFSADFDVRGALDPAGLIAEAELIRLAYAEDLDVLFIPNTNSHSLFEDSFRAQGRVLSAFDQNDLDKKIDSLFDELAYSRAQATIGKLPGTFGDVGRFALLNLPLEKTHQYIETPLIKDDPASFYAKVRAIDPNIVIHVTRPRAPKGLETGYLTAIAESEGLAPGQAIPGNSGAYSRAGITSPSDRWIDFDLLQILSSNHYDEFLLTRQDWFNLLNNGIYKPVTGGGGGPQIKDIPIGSVRTFVSVSNTTLRDNDLSEFWTNAKEGKMFVTNGPILEATINGMGYGQSTTATGMVNATVKLRAAPWIPVQELRVILDGQVVHTESNFSANVLKYEGSIAITIPNDGHKHWVVFEAGASLDQLATGTAETGTFGRIHPGHLPLAITNPIFIN